MTPLLLSVTIKSNKQNDFKVILLNMAKAFTKKKFIINVAVILIVTALAFYYLMKSDVVSLEKIRLIQPYQYAAVFSLFSVSVLLLSLIDFFVYRSVTDKMPYGKCIINTMTGHLGSSVTPFRSGHFPLMAYYQVNSGVPVYDTVTGLTKCQIIYSAVSLVSYAILTVALAIMGNYTVFQDSKVSLWLVVLVGFTFHLAVMVVLLFIIFNKRFRTFCIKIWAKITKNTDKPEVIAKWQNNLNNYRAQITDVLKNFKKFVFPAVLYLLYMVFSGSLQYFAYVTFTGYAFSVSDLFTFYTLNLASTYIANIIPVPGGFGTTEIMFSLVFVYVIPNAILGSVLVLWRMGTYYMPIVIEVVFFAVFTLTGKRKKDKTLIKEN